MEAEEFMTKENPIDERHGGPYDRGSADAYYRRKPRPHYFEGASMMSREILPPEMTERQIFEYTKGYHDQVAEGNFKDWD